MDKCIYFETERLSILPFDHTHLTERYVGWLNDPAVIEFSEQRHCKHTLESCEAYFRSMERSDNLFLAICDKPSGTHIGNVSVSIDVHNATADVSIMIGDRSFWGQGLGVEAFMAMVDRLLDSGEFRKVTAGTMAVNISMLKAMERAGMQEECRRANHYLLKGEAVDVVYFSRWRDDA